MNLARQLDNIDKTIISWQFSFPFCPDSILIGFNLSSPYKIFVLFLYWLSYCSYNFTVYSGYDNHN